MDRKEVEREILSPVWNNEYRWKVEEEILEEKKNLLGYLIKRKLGMFRTRGVENDQIT